MSSPDSGDGWFPYGEALALGALQGPAELLPVSSSGHAALVPWLGSWRYAELDPELRKSFEVALHAGTAAALLVALRGEVREQVLGMDIRQLSLIVLACLPPAIAGYTLEREIERRLGTPSTIASGLLAGAWMMAAADCAPQLRGYEQAKALDGLWLGLAQACALVPGVSRNGATLAAARARQFTRRDASRLSRTVALPVIAGATLLKALRLHGRGLPAGAGVPFAVGAAAAFASTLACSRLIGEVERDRALWPYAIYRAALASIVLVRQLRPA